MGSLFESPTPPSTTSAAGTAASSADQSESSPDHGAKRKYKNTFGGHDNISNNFMDDLDTITPLEEPWFLSNSYVTTHSSSGSSSSSSGSTWPSLPRSRDSFDSLGGGGGGGGVRKGHSYNSRVVYSPTRKFLFRTFQILSVLICVFGTYTLVINVLSLTRTSYQQDQLESYNNNNNNVTSTNTINPTNIHEQLKAWLFNNNGENSRNSLVPNDFSTKYAPTPNNIFSSPSSSSSSASYSSSTTKSLLDIKDFYFILNNVSICAAKTSSSSYQHHHQQQPPLLPPLGQGIFDPTSSSSSSLDSSTASSARPLGEGIYFMIIVHSAPGHFAERQAIRSTWGSVKSLKNWAIRLVFLLGSDPESEDSMIGKSIYRESSLFGDIVSGNFHDTYRNLTYKHLMGYKWALNFCPGATFILKTDDDAFIDIFQLFEFTSRTYGFSPEDTLLCNVFPEGTKPVRPSDPEAKEAGKKWTVTRDEYPHDTYPKYCGGLAYLITPDVLEKILRVSHNSRFFWIDDVYVTGVLRELVDQEPFYLNLRYSYEPVEYRKWLDDRRPKKIPFMIIHVERGSKFSEEMNHMWRKTMRVWSR